MLILLLLFLPSILGNYWHDRAKFIENEESLMLGSSIVLTAKEEAANRVLMGHKLREYDEGFADPAVFLPAFHFFNTSKYIEDSEVFKLIRKMPKGAALHLHDSTVVSEEFLHGLTFRKDLYACTVGGRLRMRFLQTPEQDKTCHWRLINELRAEDPGYDDWVKSQLTLKVKNPQEAYSDINKVWKVFGDLFQTVEPMISYKPVFKDNFYEGLKELHEDNVMYVEFTSHLAPAYELNGTEYDQVATAGFFKETSDEFVRDHPDFLGSRLIFAGNRQADNATATSWVDTAKKLKASHPDFLAGFDISAQEDLGHPMMSFIDQLLEMSRLGIDFFFHAAETKWYGAPSDFNLVDAVLLGTKRIGHGFALTKHPLVMGHVKANRVAVEVCPVSHQVLTLVQDMRNHPAAALLAQGYPVVISNDNPTFWGSRGLSYDFYMAFMGIASRNADLRLLKQLARNSLEFSAMPEKEKKKAVKEWEKRWERFIDEITSVGEA